MLRFRTRLLISYLCLIVILLGVSVATYEMMVSLSSKEVYQYAKESSQLIAESITRQCRGIEQEVVYNTSLFETVSNYSAGISSSTSRMDVLVQQNLLRDKLSILLHTNQSFHSIYFIGNNQEVVFSKRVNALSGFLENLDYQRELNQLIEAKSQTIWESINENYVVMKRMIHNLGSLQLEGVLEIVINKSAFYQPYDTSQAFYAMIDKREQVLFAEDKSAYQIAYDFLEMDSVSADVKNSLGTFHCTRISGKNWKGDMLVIVNKASVVHSRGVMRASLGLILGASAVMAMLLSIVFSKHLAGGVKILLNGIQRISEGNWNTHIELTQRNELYLIADGINEMTQRIRLLMDNLLRTQQAHQLAEYQSLEYRYYALRCQLNPHLLFNALESINGVAKMNQDHETGRLILRLASILRLTLRQEKVLVPLHEEIEYIHQYLQLYQLIYGNRLTTSFHLDNNTLSHEIPAFITVPFIENAMVHGLERTRESMSLTVSCFLDDCSLCIEIADNGPGFRTNQPEKEADVPRHIRHCGLGIKGVRERLALLYPNRFMLHIKPVLPHGTLVQICLNGEAVLPTDDRREPGASTFGG